MKTYSIILITLLLGLISCTDPVVTFSEPQPSAIENIKKIPEHIQGYYSNTADNSVLAITDKQLTQTFDFYLKTHIHALDTTMKLVGDTLINIYSHEKERIIRDGDSLIEHINYTDTLFTISYDNVVRKFKGYYFFNKRIAPDRWEVKKLSLSKGQLTLSSITSKQEIEQLQTITETYGDTIPPYQFAPTKKQFRQFIKHNGFSDSKTFIKLKR